MVMVTFMMEMVMMMMTMTMMMMLTMIIMMMMMMMMMTMMVIATILTLRGDEDYMAPKFSHLYLYVASKLVLKWYLLRTFYM